MRPHGTHPAAPAAAIRRRRLLAASTLALPALALAIWLSAGSGGVRPQYVPSGGGVASVITPGRLRQRRSACAR